MRAFALLFLLPPLLLAGCQTLDQELAEYRYTCAKMGHRHGSVEHTACVEGLYRDTRQQDAIRDAARPRPQTCREEKDKKGRKTTYCY